jgi:hypothetical protein
MAAIKRFPVSTDEGKIKNSGFQGGDQIIPMKLLSRQSPIAPLFSGWNWTP